MYFLDFHSISNDLIKPIAIGDSGKNISRKQRGTHIVEQKNMCVDILCVRDCIILLFYLKKHFFYLWIDWEDSFLNEGPLIGLLTRRKEVLFAQRNCVVIFVLCLRE